MATPTSPVPCVDLITRVDDALTWTGVRRLSGMELGDNEPAECWFFITAAELPAGRLTISASFPVTPGAPYMLVNLPAEPILKAIEEFGNERHDPLESDDDFTFADQATAHGLWDAICAVVFALPFVRRTETLAQVYGSQEEADAAVARAGRGWDPKKIEGRLIAPVRRRERAVA